jgi:signal transduction histidine kinase
MKFGLRQRLVLTYFLLVSLSVGGLVLRFGFLEQRQIIDRTETGLEIQAFVLASAIEAPLENFSERDISYTEFANALGHLMANIEPRLTLLTIEGEAIYDSENDFRLVANQSNQIEVRTALNNQEQHQIRFDPISQEERVFAAAPSHHEGEAVAVVQLSIPAAPMWAEVRQSWLILSSTGLLIVAAVVLASLWLANYILGPLQELQQAANAVAAGNLAQRLPNASQDELGDVARAFNRMAAQLSEMISQQQQFVANASHELRTPLTNIKLRAEALREGAIEDPDIAPKFLADIEHEADRMNALTQQLLTLSRLDAAPSQPEFQQVDLLALLNDSLRVFEPQAQEKNQRLSLTCPPQLPPIRGEAGQLRQVVDNLLSNALKYSPPGGHIELTALARPHSVQLTLSDTGPGIPTADLPHIFERFYRVDKARTRLKNDPGGTGLGLAIVQSIVTRLGGHIEVTSSPEHGTRFTLSLPVAG